MNEVITVDGTVVSQWSRSLFEDMRKGGLTAVNCTCAVWDDFRSAMEKIAASKAMIEANSDIVQQVYTVGDIRAARNADKVGIILGWQNMDGIDGQIPFLRLFHELGVRIMQLTYNTQNLLGSGCYESRDGGLSDFGLEVVSEMNRLGIVVDLSHVGSKTSADAIKHSKQPVCYSHVAPSALKDHPRCKSDDEFRTITGKGGFIGLTPYSPFTPKGPDSTLDDYLDAIEHTIGVVGDESLGIATDFSYGEPHDMDYFMRDKGYARLIVDLTEVTYPEGFGTCADYPNLIRAMEARGWSEARIRRLAGENWLAFLERVWGS